MITREIDYAMRAVLYLAKQCEPGTSVKTSKLADDMSLPYRFLRKIVNKLTNAGITASRRGKSGGVSLIKAVEEISLLDVVNAIDSNAMKVNICTASGNCERITNCAMFREMVSLQSSIDNGLSAAKFSDLVGKPDASDAILMSSR